MQYTKNDIFEIITNHLHETNYFLPEIKPESNWYTDLGLNSFDKCEFYAWAEEKFAIRIPFIYFTNIDSLVEVIYRQLPAKYKPANTKQQSLLERIKQKFISRQK